MWPASIALILAGCNSLLGIHSLANTNGDAVANDDSLVPNDVIPTTDGTACFGSGGFTVCLTALPTSPQVLSGTIDTDASPECYSGYDVPADHPWCVVVGTAIAVSSGAPLLATGAKPLVLLATGDLTIAGGATVDVSSHAGGANGPASNVICAPAGGGAYSLDQDMGGGGGAGGSFAMTGGNGGDGDPGTAGAATLVVGTPTGLYGGCPGGRGGEGAEPGSDTCQPTASGPPGAGGGAVYLVAGGTVRIDGDVAASGAGGGPGLIARGGGSGGGSGGLIAIWSATTVSGTGLLITSGGGGGGGADHCGNANPGGDPAIDMLGGGASGAGADVDCPNGGAGGSGTSVGGNGSTGGSKGGSAGGGGVGYVMIHSSATFPGTISGVTTPF